MVAAVVNTPVRKVSREGCFDVNGGVIASVTGVNIIFIRRERWGCYELERRVGCFMTVKM